MFKPFRYLSIFLALVVLQTTNAHADWTDDVTAIRRLMRASDYAGAEAYCTQSLTHGPSGLFSGTGTLVIHHWRGRARLIQGNVAGAIEDGDIIVRTEGTMYPPDPGYTLRGVAKALQGDAAGANSEFEALSKIDRSGMAETMRHGGFYGERAIARILIDDLDGAEADLSAAIALDYGFLGGETMRLSKDAWMEMRSALQSLKTGDRTAALAGFQRARSILKVNAPENILSSDFVLAELLLNKFSAQQKPQSIGQGMSTAKLISNAAPVFAGKVLPRQQSYWGMVVRDGDSSGIILSAVKNESPAGAAGLAAGDTLVAIEGKPVYSVRAFRAIKNTFPYFTPLKLEVVRDGQRLERTIVLYGIAPLKLKPARVEFAIPGIPSATEVQIEAHGRINVLDQVVLDPTNGKLAIIGHYDERYRTGTLPYLDMLKTALQHPKPKLNLETEFDTTQLLAKLETERKDWPTKEVVLTHPALEQDRQLLIKAWASAIGLLPEELVILYNYAHFSQKSIIPPEHVRKIQEKLLRKLGYPQAAEAYGLLSQPSADAPLKAMRLLGRGPEATAIQSRMAGNANEFRGVLMAEGYLTLLEQIHMPTGEIANLRHDLQHNRRSWQNIVSAAQGSLIPARANQDNRELAKLALNTLMLSNKGSRALFPELMDNSAVLTPIDLDPNSQLARVLYEADYSLKSMVVMPHLFRHIPEATSLQEYEINKPGRVSPGDTQVETHHWLEPEQVSMQVSASRQLIIFGPTRMRYRTRVHEATGDLPPPEDFYADWNASFTRHYEEYARVMPAFHSVREAAKIIALANWLHDEKISVDLGDLRQSPWEAPKKVPGFWRVALSYVPKGGDDYSNSYQIGFTGGVTFKRQNWTQVSAAPPASETGVSSQLALSAGLGQQAVQAAAGGDLEAARHLAELSAQAMSGRLSPSELAKIKTSVPVPSKAPVGPEFIRLQQALQQRTAQQIDVLRQSPTHAPEAKAALKELGRLYREARDNPVAASDYLARLQTQGTSPAAPTAPSVPAGERVTNSVCGQPVSGGVAFAQGRTAHLSLRLDEARDRLRYINEALKRLIAINASQRAEIDKLTGEISERYEEAQDRAWEVVIDLMTGVSLDAFSAEHVKRLKGIDDAIAAKVALKSTPQDPASLRAIENEITLLESAKFRAGEAYASTDELVNQFKRSKTTKDVDDWWRENEGLVERAKSAVALAAGLSLDHPWLEKWLGRQAFFAGEKLWQVTTMGRLAYYAAGFGYDILTQWTIWEPMTHRMQNELQYNVQAIEKLRLRAEQASREVDCLKTMLR